MRYADAPDGAAITLHRACARCCRHEGSFTSRAHWWWPLGSTHEQWSGAAMLTKASVSGVGRRVEGIERELGRTD